MKRKEMNNLLELSYGSLDVLLTELLTLIDDAVIMIDDSYSIQFFNQGAENMFGYSHKDIIGLPLDLLLPERFRKSHRELIKNFAKSKVSAKHMAGRSPIVGVRQNGKEFNAEASIAQLELGKRKIYLVIMRDISWKEELEQELNKTVTHVHNLSSIMGRLEELGHEVGYRLAHPKLLEESEGAHRRMLEELEETETSKPNKKEGNK